MKNLRIRTELNGFNELGQEIMVHHVVKDYDTTKFKYAQSVLDKGEIVESFNTKANAETFLKAIKMQGAIEVMAGALINLSNEWSNNWDIVIDTLGNELAEQLDDGAIESRKVIKGVI
jgi:hypothetical protein